MKSATICIIGTMSNDLICIQNAYKMSIVSVDINGSINQFSRMPPICLFFHYEDLVCVILKR